VIQHTISCPTDQLIDITLRDGPSPITYSIHHLIIVGCDEDGVPNGLEFCGNIRLLGMAAYTEWLMSAPMGKDGVEEPPVGELIERLRAIPSQADPHLYVGSV